MKVRAKTPTSVRDIVAAAGPELVREISGGGILPKETGPPTKEIGAQTSLGVLPWSQMWVGDPLEVVPQLMWPQSVWTYAAMMNDSQLDGLHIGSTIPIRRYNWFIDPNGCDPKAVKKLAADFNLPLEGEEDQPRGRLRKRFSHDKHMFHAFKALAFGFYYMETCGEIQDDGLWHMTKLSPRPPLTIMDFDIDGTGELVAIRQNITQPGVPVQPIPASRLVKYIWEQEGANWTGHSMMRSLYRNWLIKDRLLRVDALKHERNGMGIPKTKAAPGASKVEMEALSRAAQQAKAGDVSGVTLPDGSDMELMGVKGTLPDTIASINYHDEAMARKYLMMFMQLGSTLHGSRALGSEFIDYFQLAQETLANWYRDTTNEDVIEENWLWNYGETDTVPRLEYHREDDPLLAIEPLVKCVENGIIRVDDELEETVREAMDISSFKGPEREMKLPPMISKTNKDLPIPGAPCTPSAPDEGGGTPPTAATARRLGRVGRWRKGLARALQPNEEKNDA